MRCNERVDAVVKAVRAGGMVGLRGFEPPGTDPSI